MIYMIRAGDDGPVKIGFGKNVRQRLSMLQTGHSQRLTIMRVFEGGKAEEAQLHARFAELRLRKRGEWFAPDAAMLGDLGLVEIFLAPPVRKVRKLTVKKVRPSAKLRERKISRAERRRVETHGPRFFDRPADPGFMPGGAFWPDSPQ